MSRRASSGFQSKRFFQGFGRAVDLGGRTGIVSRRSRRSGRTLSDAAALALDWTAVWSDLDAAFHCVKESGGYAR